MINIDNLIKESMKSQNKVELRAYKNLKAEIQTFKTAKNAKPYDEAAEIKLISKMCKKLEDGILDFSKASREDLVSEYRDELEVLKKLLPKPVNESDIKNEIGYISGYMGKFGEEENPSCKITIPKKEMRNIIKYLKSKFPQADGKIISEIVKKYIV